MCKDTDVFPCSVVEDNAVDSQTVVKNASQAKCLSSEQVAKQPV